MSPISESEKAKKGIVNGVLTLSRACVHARGGELRDLKMLKRIKAKSYELPLDVKRQLANKLTPKLGTGVIRKLGSENTLSIRPGITKAMGQIPLAYEYALRRRDNQLTENTMLDANTCERCQYCVEQLLLTDKGLFRLNMLCYSMAFLCEPETVCRLWHEGQGRTIVISDIRSKQEMAKKSCKEILMEYVEDCVEDGERKDAFYVKERMQISQAKAKEEKK